MWLDVLTQQHGDFNKFDALSTETVSLSCIGIVWAIETQNDLGQSKPYLQYQWMETWQTGASTFVDNRNPNALHVSNSRCWIMIELEINANKCATNINVD